MFFLKSIAAGGSPAFTAGAVVKPVVKTAAKMISLKYIRGFSCY